MSSFANEQLSLYLRPKMGLFATRVKPIELMAHLPCLTPIDKEEIQAKKDFSGNFTAMQLLMDYLQKRLNWAEQFIRALDSLEHHDLAEDLRVEWNRWNRIPRANVHPAPPTSPSPALSERSGDSPPILVHQAQPVNPSGPTPNAAPLPVVADQPVASPPASASPVVAAPPPPSPVVAAPPTASPSPVGAAPPPASPSPVVAAPPPALTSPVVLNPPISAPPTSPPGSALVQTPVKRSVQDTSPPTVRVITVQQEAVRHSVPVVNEVTEEDQHTVLLQRSQSQQPPNQLRGQQFFQGQQSSPPPEGAVCSSMDDADQFISKPGILISGIQFLGSPTGLSPISEYGQSPYSGDSGRLEISESVSESVAPPQTGLATAGSPGPVTSDPVTTASPPLCRENRFAEGTLSHSEGPMNKQPSEPLPLSHNEPEENTYDSNCLSSLGNQEVLFNVVHVSEDASILNNDGQTTSMLGIKVLCASEPPPPVQKHDSQSQIMPVVLSTDPDSLSEPNQYQREDSLVNFVNKPLEFQSPCLNIIDNGPSSNQPGSAIPPAIGATVSGSSSHDNGNPQPAVAGVMPKNWKQEKLEASGVGIYYLLGAAFVSISLFVAWRMKK